MTDTYRVTVQIDKITETPEEKNQYRDVVKPASRVSVELVAGTFSTTDETTVRDRVTSMLDAAGIKPSTDKE